MGKMCKTGAIALVLLLAVSCRNVVFIPVPLPGDDKGGVPGSVENPYVVSDAEALQSIVTRLESAEGTVYVEISSDIALDMPTEKDSMAMLTIPAGGALDLDLNGHTITASEDVSSQRVYLFETYGNLTIHGNGRIGGHWKENAIPRAVAVYEGATLNMSDTEVFAFSELQGSCLFVQGAANLDNVTINTTYYGIGADIASELTMNNSKVVSIASNALKYENGVAGHAYTISASGTTEISNTEVYGVQGGIAIIAGSAKLCDGIHSETTANIFNYIEPEFQDDFAAFFAAHNMNSATNPSPVECYYGIYIAGEAAIGNSPMCEVYGGEYISAYRNAVLVGNSNSHDGGEGETAYATIYDGTFISPKNFMTINADENPQYGHGVLSIEGGRFTSAENLDKYIDSTRFEVSAEPVDGYYVVSTI